MAFNLTKCLQVLRNRSHAKSLHACAGYVKTALHAGGLPYENGDGYKVGSAYEKHGWRRVNLQRQGRGFLGAMPGDICSISKTVGNARFAGYAKRNPDGEVYPGHACMYDGNQWISDFRQGFNAIPYSSNVKWARVWRWKDLPGDYNVPPDDNSYSSGEGGEMGEGGGGGGGPMQIVFVENVYPTHNEYTTYQGEGGNIFEKTDSGKNTLKLKAAVLADKDNETTEFFDRKNENNHNTRIYSTNDSCIVLDELVIRPDGLTKKEQQRLADEESFANKGIEEKDVSAHKAKLKQEEEEAKKKAEEEKKKAEEEAKKKAAESGTITTDSSTNKDNKEKDKNKDNKDKDKDKDKNKDKSKK